MGLALLGERVFALISDVVSPVCAGPVPEISEVQSVFIDIHEKSLVVSLFLNWVISGLVYHERHVQFVGGHVPAVKHQLPSPQSFQHYQNEELE